MLKTITIDGKVYREVEEVVEEQDTESELVKWAEDLGYPHDEQKIRVIARNNSTGQYFSFDTSTICEIQEKWPDRTILGAHDENGEWIVAVK